MWKLFREQARKRFAEWREVQEQPKYLPEIPLESEIPIQKQYTEGILGGAFIPILIVVVVGGIGYYLYSRRK